MRLAQPGITPTGQRLMLDFDGRAIEALAGESVAAALSAAGVLRLRDTLSGAPRGVFCGMGACFDCLVTIDGHIGQRACMVRAADGMRISADPPSAPEPQAAMPSGEDAPEEACDILIVGGGPAGLSAAIAARQAGAEVVLLDERAQPGGQYLKPLAASHRARRPDRQFALGNAMRARAAALGVRLVSEAMVWGAFGAGEIAAIVAGRAITFRPRRLILAPGAHERPMPLPGWTLPGVMTTGALQTLARSQRVCPAGPVLIAGNGPLNLQLACELLDGGVAVAAVVEAAAKPGPRSLADGIEMLRRSAPLAREGLRLLRRLRRAGVPVLWSSAIERLEGEAQVAAAVLRTPAGPRRIAAGLVAMNHGFQPDVTLARALGLAHRFVPEGIGHLATVTDAEGRSDNPAVFAVGDGASLGGARVAMGRGRLAGTAAAGDLGFLSRRDKFTPGLLRRDEAFQRALWRLFAAPAFDPAAIADETILCRCESITAGRLRGEVEGGLASLPALKKATRAGMGRCQGRFCAASIARLLPEAPDAEGFAAPRAPVRPVPAAALMFPAPEFEAPLIEAPSLPRHRHALPPLAAEHRACDVLVIGAGNVGQACAYYLAAEGADVLLADRDEAGMAASTANAGSLHAQLLSYDFTEATPPDGGPAGQTVPLGPRSIALWHEIAAAAGESLGLTQAGGLMLADSAAAMDWLQRKSALEARLGLRTELLDAAELRRRAPALDARMHGALFCAEEGHGDPLRGMMALRRLALAHGARLLRGAEIAGLAREGAGWRVRTSKGEIACGRVVNAAGPWAAAIAAHAGLALPVRGTVQQVIVTEPAPPMLSQLVAYAGRHLSLKQHASGGMLIGGGWFGDFDRERGATRNLRRNIQGNLWVAGQVLPALHGLAILRAWTGLAVAIDGGPILGEAPGVPGFFNAVAANAYTLGPILGRLTADAVLRGASLPPAYRLERFAQPAPA